MVNLDDLLPRPRTPRDYLDLAADPSIGREVLLALADSEYPFVQIAVAEHPCSDAAVLAHLAHLVTADTAGAACRRRSWPVEPLPAAAYRCRASQRRPADPAGRPRCRPDAAGRARWSAVRGGSRPGQAARTDRRRDPPDAGCAGGVPPDAVRRAAAPGSPQSVTTDHGPASATPSWSWSHWAARPANLLTDLLSDLRPVRGPTRNLLGAGRARP